VKAMATRLSDGMPITTEWLNQLVAEINELKNSNSSSSSSSQAAQRVVEFYGPGLAGNTPIQVQTGSFQTQAAASQALVEGNVNFSIPFADNNVFIVATPTFSDSTGKPARASVSVSNIRAASFKMTVMLVNDRDLFTADKTVTVNYIAIGKKK
jgi:hypothetical protein